MINSYFLLIDVIELSCVCKDFYCLSRTNAFYVRTLKESSGIFQDKSDVVSAYSNYSKELYLALFKKLTPFVKVDNILKIRKTVRNELFHTILPFRVWNHLFLCSRSQYDSRMCLFRTKIYLKNKRLSPSIEKNLTVDVLDIFPVHLSYGVISSGQVPLFVHTSIVDKQKRLAFNSNFGTLFYEVINSLFMLWKFTWIS